MVYSPDVRRPVEVTADQEDQLVKWLSKRLGTPVSPPKLGALGYELIGGRLLPPAGHLRALYGEDLSYPALLWQRLRKAGSRLRRG